MAGSAMQVRRAGYGLHHVIVGWDTYDERVLQDSLEARVHAVEAATWDGIASQLRLLSG
jgi:hypothetical protein